MHNDTNAYTFGFSEIDKTKHALVGGNGASLGELSRIEGIKVPQGFCVTTSAYKTVIERTPGFDALLDQLTFLTIEDHAHACFACEQTSGDGYTRKIRSAHQRRTLPPVVGVENATKLIKDRERIRVNGTEGYIEIIV
jgi:rifampicin phosphotransferase